MKEYCKVWLMISRFDEEDIVCASNGAFAGYDDNDVLGEDPGLWETGY